MNRRYGKLGFVRAATAVAVLATICLAGTAQAQTRTMVGNAQKVVNSVEGALATTTRTIALQDQVFQNEVIRTGERSATELKFRDDTTITVGPVAEVSLDTFVFDNDPTKGKLVVRQTLGTLRFVSGKFSSQAYEIRTPTATIGVRGTVFTVTVAANGATTVSVAQGAVAVSNAAGLTQTVNAGFSSSVGPAPVGAAPLRSVWPPPLRSV